MNDYGINAIITADSSGFTKAIQKAEQSLSGFGNDLEKVTGKVTDGLKSWGVDLGKFYDKGSSIFKSFGVDIDQFASHFGMSGALMSGIVAVTTALNKMGEAVNKATSEIVKGTGKIGNELRTLESTAKDAMLQGVGGSAQEAGKIIANLNTRFGVTGKEAVALADSFDQLSHVMGVSASDSVNSVADAIKKWGMTTSETIPLLDKLTVASQESGASFDSLLSGITNGQAIFSQLGMSVTDSIAFLSSLSAEGISTESAMTGLRTAIAKFANDNESASQGFARVSEEIKNATSQTEAMRIATETFGTRAGAEMLRVLQSESVAVEDLKKKLNEATGALARTDEASRTASDAWKDLKLSLQATFGSFGQGINDLFRDIIDTIKNFVAMIDPIIRPIGEVFRFVFGGIGTIVHATSTALLGLFDTETEVERISKLTADAIKKQAEETAKLKNEVITLDQAERNRLKAQISQGMSQEYNQIRDLTKDLNGLIAKHDELEKKLQEVNENEYELGQIADQYRDVETQIGNLSAIIELHTAKYEGYKDELSAITDVEQLEAKERIKTAQEEADEKERLQKQAFEKLESMSEQFTDKEYQQSLQRLRNEMANEVQLAQNAGKSQDEIFAIKQKYQTDINDLLKKQIDKEEEAELAKLDAIKKILEETGQSTEKIQALRTKITDYYTNERKALEVEAIQAVTEELEEQIEPIKQNYSWDIKILQLQKDSLESEEDKKEIQKQILTLQKAEALANATNADEAQKIEIYYNMLIADLDKVVESEHEILATETKIEEVKRADYSWTQKLKQQELSRLQTAMDSAVERAKAEGKSEEEIAKIKEEYFTEMQNKQLELLALQKEIDLARSTSAEQAFEIDTYYTNEEIALAEETAKKIAEAYSAIPSPLASEKDSGEGSKATGKPVSDTGDKTTSGEKSTELADYFKTLADMSAEYNNKLEAQKLARIEKEKSYDLEQLKEQGASQEEIFAVNKAYTERILNMKLEALEEEKQALLDSLPDDENYAQLRADIEKYYLNEETEMRKDAYKEIEKERAKDSKNQESTWSKMLKGVSTVSKYMVNGFKSAFSAIGKIISGVWSGFVKALDFNPDETLDGLLAFEDKILTFFYDTLPQLPSFLANALQSIGTLLNTLLENIDFSGLAEMLADALGNAVDILPSLIQGVIKIVGEIVKQLPSIIKKVMPKIISALKTIVKALPEILPDFIKGIFEMINELARSLPEVLPELIKGVIELIKALITELPTTIDLLLTGIADTLTQLLSNPDEIAKFIHVIMDSMGKIAKSLLENAGVIFGAIIEILPDVLMAILVDLPSILGKIFEGAWNGVIAVLKGTVNALIKGVNFITQGLSMAWTWLGIPAIPKIPLLAKGTDNAQKGLAVVGEAGPELVNFRGGEQVLNNKKTNEVLSGSKTNNFNVTFNNVNDTSAYALVQQLKRYNREMAFNGVL